MSATITGVEGIADAARRLRQGELVVFPTETVYGLGANALDRQAVARIFSTKGRPSGNPLIVHVANADAARALAAPGAWSDAAQMLAGRFWPGPLTLVVEKAAHVPGIVTAGGPTVGVRDIVIALEGQEVHLKGFGFVRVFRTVDPHGNAEHWATSKLGMSEAERQEVARQVFSIENYHRGLKQCCGVERCFARTRVRQTNHVLLSVRAFVRLEVNRTRHQVTWYAAKVGMVRQAVRETTWLNRI